MRSCRPSHKRFGSDALASADCSQASTAAARCEELQAKLAAEEMLQKKAVQEMKQSAKRYEVTLSPPPKTSRIPPSG